MFGCEVEQGTTTISMDPTLAGGFFDAPWPSDTRRRADGSLDLTGFPGRSSIVLADIVLGRGAAATKGFGTNSGVFLRASGPIDAGTLPLFGLGPMGRRGTLMLLDLDNPSAPPLGRAYEYFLGRFAEAEGKRGGQFYTPQSVVRLLVEMIEPYRGRVYDPCCGSGGMFVQSENFVAAHGGNRTDISIYGQESNPTTWRLCRMNLAIRGISGNIGTHNADSFLNDLHKDLRADFILANPPFNMSEWGLPQLVNDVRWQYGQPPANNANYAWIQHMVHHLAPNGIMGLVLANGSMSTQTGGEGDIRKKLVEADLVDCMVALPGQLFYTTQIPVCLWFLARNKGARGSLRDRRGETLFMDARQMGRLVDRTHRDLDDADLENIAGVYHAWRGETEGYADAPGFCKAATLAEIRSHDYVLTPGRYVGAAEVEADGEPFEEKMERLYVALLEQFEHSAKLERDIRISLGKFQGDPIDNS